MNVQRLVTITAALRTELRTVPDQVAQLVGLVEEAINSQNESNQRAVETQLEAMRAELRSAASNSFSPGTRVELAELQTGRTPVALLVGVGLAERLDQILAGSYTSVQALDKLRTIAEETAVFKSAVENTANGLKGLGVSGEELQPGVSVVGMTIPRSAVAAGLLSLETQVKFFGQFLLELSETVEGKAEDPKVYSLQSSDFGIDLNTSINLAGVFSLIVKGTKKALDGLRKYRALRKQAEDIGVKPELADQLGKEGSSGMEHSIIEIQLEVIQKHCVVENEGRRNELSNALKLRINGLANRMDQGFSFEVRTNLPPDAPKEQRVMAEHVAALTSISFGPVDGPRLLSLPEVEDEDEGEGKKKS